MTRRSNADSKDSLVDDERKIKKTPEEIKRSHGYFSTFYSDRYSANVRRVTVEDSTRERLNSQANTRYISTNIDVDTSFPVYLTSPPADKAPY